MDYVRKHCGFFLLVLVLASPAGAVNPLLKGNLLQTLTVASATDDIPSGWCGRGMLSLMNKAGLARGLKPGNGQDWEQILVNAGWKPVKVACPARAPLGSVLVYSGDQRLGKSRAEPPAAISAMSKWFRSHRMAGEFMCPTARGSFPAAVCRTISPDGPGCLPAHCWALLSPWIRRWKSSFNSGSRWRRLISARSGPNTPRFKLRCERPSRRSASKAVYPPANSSVGFPAYWNPERFTPPTPREKSRA